MRYDLYVYVIDPKYADAIHSVNKKFYTLNEALYYYNQYNGIEISSYSDYNRVDADIVFCVGIYKVDNKKDIFEMVKEKYKPLYLKNLYFDFWHLFNIIKNI